MSDTPQEPAAEERRCIVDDGQMCPNTCAREGRCVWSPREPTAEAALSLRRSADSLKSMLDAAYQRGRLAGREEAAKAVANMRSCPFDKGASPHDLRPEDPCPVCGDLGIDTDTPSNCQSPAAVIRSLPQEVG